MVLDRVWGGGQVSGRGAAGTSGWHLWVSGMPPHGPQVPAGGPWSRSLASSLSTGVDRPSSLPKARKPRSREAASSFSALS